MLISCCASQALRNTTLETLHRGNHEQPKECNWNHKQPKECNLNHKQPKECNWSHEQLMLPFLPPPMAIPPMTADTAAKLQWLSLYILCCCCTGCCGCGPRPDHHCFGAAKPNFTARTKLLGQGGTIQARTSDSATTSRIRSVQQGHENTSKCRSALP